jgi:hypothetical protein
MSDVEQENPTGTAHLTGSAAAAAAGRSHLNRIFVLLSEMGGRTSPADHLEEETFRVREGFHHFRLDAVEQDAPETDFSTQSRSESVQLIYFARALQRTQLIGHFFHKGIEVPVHYAITGSIILERQNRKFKVWRKPELTTNVMLPFQYIDRKDVLERFQSDDQVRLIDTEGDRPEYTQLRIAAVRKARELTLELRSKLCSAWGLSDGQDLQKYMVLSGTVADIPNDKLGANFFAIARRVYVPWINSELIEPQLLTKPYHRGQLLRTTNTQGDDPMKKYTWFIRMRSSSQADPEFGLVRCTCLADSDEQAIEKANHISGRLIDERLPVTFPAEGWDKLIFPMKLCNDFLESMVATRETVKSYFARD